MANVLDAAMNLANEFPEIPRPIKAEEVVRISDKRWQDGANTAFAVGKNCLEISAQLLGIDAVELKIGRPPLSGSALYISGTPGSLWFIEPADELGSLLASMSLGHYLSPYTDRFPGRTTVLENANAVSHETHGLIPSLI